MNKIIDVYIHIYIRRRIDTKMRKYYKGTKTYNTS